MPIVSPGVPNMRSRSTSAIPATRRVVTAAGCRMVDDIARMHRRIIGLEDWAPTETRVIPYAGEPVCQLGGDVLGVDLYRHLACGGETAVAASAGSPIRGAGCEARRSTASEGDRIESLPRLISFQLGQQSGDVALGGAVLSYYDGEIAIGTDFGRKTGCGCRRSSRLLLRPPIPESRGRCASRPRS